MQNLKLFLELKITRATQQNKIIGQTERDEGKFCFKFSHIRFKLREGEKDEKSRKENVLILFLNQ